MLANLDRNGEGMKDEQGVWMYQMVIGADGHVSSSRHLNKKQESVADDHGIFEKRFKYDAAGNQIEIAAFDAAGRPIANTQTGISIIRSTFDDRGNEVADHYFDAEGKPTLHKEGQFASVERGQYIRL